MYYSLSLIIDKNIRINHRHCCLIWQYDLATDSICYEADNILRSASALFIYPWITRRKNADYRNLWIYFCYRG